MIGFSRHGDAAIKENQSFFFMSYFLHTRRKREREREREIKMAACDQPATHVAQCSTTFQFQEIRTDAIVFGYFHLLNKSNTICHSFLWGGAETDCVQD